ncbi:MAG TPA: class A beta-lactamase, subclass A2 [Bacteroidia bacterium]|jgi:beta-lactamase class A|nr:class A beta-lactamase, subclass A2 [Bacteroidia bacterium]
MIKHITCLLLLVGLNATAQISTLKSNIESLCKSKKATIGVALYDFEKGDMLSINGDGHFPMQSVFKLPVAVTLLNEIDKGKFSLDQKVVITRKELLPKTWSPMRDDHPQGNVQLSLAEILSYTVSKSDNNGCDILFRQLGGPQVVNDYMHSIGIKNCAIQFTEEEMAKGWDVQYNNWTSPKEATSLLKLIYQQKILSQKSYDFLWKIMVETSTCPKRIKGQLSENIVVAHKTGTSDTNQEGITAAVNDIGIIKLPNGKSFAISIFVSNSSENMDVNEKIIADISKLAVDYFLQ